MNNTSKNTSTRNQSVHPDDAIAILLLAVQKINPTLTAFESSQITTKLISQLALTINSEIINNYLQAIHYGQQDIFSAPITREYPQGVELPNLLNISPPNYSIGSKVRLTPIDGATEWGTLIGYYLCYASHRCKWQWKYILFLDFDSPSADWVKTTFAWQDEIECELGEK
ncbi:hypothetical protein [Tolypothrix sp. VBCCA 56010]|uniref:hypothetical protein n=1 Tax=Tolypothrix sp. VBCCA 56010 TaxID=3137731 RepID=UPI003D7EE55A